MTAKRHHVHVYATIRVKVAVDANNHDEAMRLSSPTRSTPTQSS
jgi:hypothetical protein